MPDPVAPAPAPTSFKRSTLSWASLVLGAVPALLAVFLASPLDDWPYVLCGGIGAVLGYPLVLRGWRNLAGTARSAMWLGIWIAPPLWGIGLGVGGNALLDGSAATEHPSEVVGRVRSGKNTYKLLLRSWREGHEKESHPDRLGARPGDAVIVTTRSGFFGWEWVTHLRRAPR